MKLFIQNHVYRIVTISKMINSLGTYLYNLVFIIYAAGLDQANVAIFIANVVTIVPSLFTFWVGIKADRTQQKAKWMILTGFVQAIVFTLVAFLIGDQTFLIFSVLCLLNIISDVLGDYAGDLRLPIIQKNVPTDHLFEAYSFFQFITYLSSIVGQAVGVWLLTVSNQNFALVALINAVSFAVSSIILLKDQACLTYEKVEETSEKIYLVKQFKKMYATMEEIFKKSNDVSFIKLLTSILFLNTLGGAVGSVYHFYLMEHPLFQLHYGQALLAVEMVLLIGAILGSMFPNDYFGKLPLSTLLIINSFLFGVLGILNAVHGSDFLSMSLLFMVAYIMGKAVPKLDALLMEHLPADLLAQSNNFLSMLFTLSLPVGTVLFSTLGVYNINLCWIVFALIAFIATYLSLKKDRSLIRKG